MEIHLGIFDSYLILMNCIGFIFAAMNTWLYSHTVNKQIDMLMTICTLSGGSLGIVSAIVLLDRKAEKGNMMFRVFASCVLVIQIVLFLIIKGHISDHITLNFLKFFDQHKIFPVYLVIINVVTFAAFAIDKMNAMKNRSRIRIVTLLGLSFAGGAIGGITAMYTFRHKTQKDYFTLGEPLIIVMQLVLLFYLMNAKW